MFTKEQKKGTISVGADVKRPLAPPVGLNHSKSHTFKNFPLQLTPKDIFACTLSLCKQQVVLVVLIHQPLLK